MHFNFRYHSLFSDCILLNSILKYHGIQCRNRIKYIKKKLWILKAPRYDDMCLYKPCSHLLFYWLHVFYLFTEGFFRAIWQYWILPFNSNICTFAVVFINVLMCCIWCWRMCAEKVIGPRGNCWSVPRDYSSLHLSSWFQYSIWSKYLHEYSKYRHEYS